MSTTLSDEDLVRSLRARADATLPPMALDHGDTVAAGRRHRRRRALVGAASGVGALALATAVAVGAISLPDRTPVATQAPRTLGTETSVEVATHMWAANAPVERTAPDGTWWDLGLSVALDEADGTGDDVFTIGMDVMGAPQQGLTGIRIGARDGYGNGSGALNGEATEIHWATDDGPGGYDEEHRYPSPEAITFASPIFTLSKKGTYDVTVVVGTVPPWLENPRVFVTYPDGIPDHEATTWSDGTTFEVPTFRAPSDDGRLLFTIRENATVANRLNYPNPAFATFVGADGTTVAGAGCQADGACDLTADQVLVRAGS